MWPIILADSWLIFLIPLIICGLVIWAIEDESAPGATAALAGGMVVIWLFTDVPIFGWMRQHLAMLLYLAVVYVACGAGWGLAKWYFHCLNESDRYDEQRDARQKEYAGLSESRRNELSYAKWLAKFYFFPPNARENKARITTWMVYWPWSAFWTLLNEPVKRMWRAIYEQFSQLYTRIAKHVFGRFDELNG